MMAQVRRQSVVLAALFVVALAVRWQALDEPLFGFHPTRQFRSATIARACFFERATHVPEWARLVALANRAIQPAGEPPLLEWLACGVYQTLGEEQLAVPRAMSAAAWVAGGGALAWLAHRWLSPGGSLLAVTIFLFAPYGIIASRAFQPDALMTTCALWALLAVTRLHERPTRPRLLVAAAALALAGVVKPMSVFITVPGALAIAYAHTPVVGALRRGRTYAPVLLGLLPVAVVYGYGALFGTLARDQMQLRFVPSLLPTEFFWFGLWTQMQRVFGWSLLVVAVAGTALARRGIRLLLLSLWGGYAAFAVAFTYHMPTHDYYHLPYLALAALAAGSLWDRLVSGVTWWRWHLDSLRAAGMCAALLVAWGVSRAGPQDHLADRERIARFATIGALAEHAPRVLFLDAEYGYSLMYYAQVAGDAWPTSDDLTAERLGGALPLTAVERFERDFEDYGAEFFIVTDLESLAAQPDLAALLTVRARAVARTPHYHVYRFVSLSLAP